MFTESFDKYVCEGDSISCEVEGFRVVARLYRDDCGDAPWERSDGHGPVSEWTGRDKKPGELVLVADRYSRRYYDYAEACRMALADGWGMKDGQLEGESKPAYAARAARHDFEVLAAWCADEWHYYGVDVTVYRAGVQLTDDYAHALWGLEGNYPGSDNGYLTEVACELLDAAVDSARLKIAELTQD